MHILKQIFSIRGEFTSIPATRAHTTDPTMPMLLLIIINHSTYRLIKYRLIKYSKQIIIFCMQIKLDKEYSLLAMDELLSYFIKL